MKIAFALCFAAVALAQDPLTDWLDARAQKFLAERKTKIAAIKTPEEIKSRQAMVRAKMLELLGGLPAATNSLNAKVTKRHDMGAYMIENVMYESLPNYWVTANVYRPKAPGRYPAILHPMGHWQEGKAAAQRIAANLAMRGFVVMPFDPVGQGERVQGFSADLGRGLTGGPTAQHFMAGAQAQLMGVEFARYMIWDGMRGIDYLQSRPDVDPERIGCTGCSGGGTQTTFIGALDPRVKVAAVSCYMQTFEQLFKGPVGDSEQSWNGFISSGLDQTDFVELFAPKPWLITSTEQDFFTPAAAKPVYEEASRWYERLGVSGNVKWVVGPGGHGQPLVVREAIYEWFAKHLGGGKASGKELEVNMLPDHELWVTAKGQLELEGYTHSIHDVIAAEKPRAHKLAALATSALTARVVSDTATRRELMFKVEDDLETPATLLIPAQPKGTAVLVVENGGKLSGRAEALAKRGHVVLAVRPRGIPVRPNTPPFSGDWITNERAWLVGLNLPRLRAQDIARAAAYLKSQPGVSSVVAHASGTAGVWLLMAAAETKLFAGLWLDRTPHSLRAAMGRKAHSNLHDVTVPGMLAATDLPQLRPAKTLWSDPTDWNFNVVPLKGDYHYRTFDEGDEPLITKFLQ